MNPPVVDKLGLIAGNGEFPVLIARECTRLGIPVVVAAIREEADPALESLAARIEWMGLGQLGRAIRFLRKEGVRQAIMAGHVKQVRIFGKDHPDLRMLALLARLPQRNPDRLLGAIAAELERDGIELLDSTCLLQQIVPREGVLTKRSPGGREKSDIEYGLPIAREIARMDLGQTIVVCHKQVVAVEALEGTDACIERAGDLTHGQQLTVIKVSKPSQDMRFDVPVIGRRTIEVLERAHATVMTVDAGRSLIFEKEAVLDLADAAGISLVAVAPPADDGSADAGSESP
jgi:DUF1009 family protein